MKADNESCYEGELIGYIQSSADVASVLELELLLDSDSHPSMWQLDRKRIGELQTYLSALEASQNETRLFYKNDALAGQIERLQNQLVIYRKLASTLTRQRKLSIQELDLAREKFVVDSTLYQRQVTSTLDFNRAKSEWVQHQRSMRNTEAAFFNNELQLKQLEKQISDLTILRDETIERLQLTVTNAHIELENQLQKWKDNYLFLAPYEGQVAHLGFLDNNLFVESGRPLFTILPTKGDIVARATLPISGSGKVKVGQRVNIRLANYPFEQYGILGGIVKSISQIPTNNTYVMVVDLPDKLVTSQKIEIAFRQELSGTSEIVTEELRLISRLIYHVRLLFSSDNS